MSRPRGIAGRRRAFTLVEVLLALGVAAVLFGMIFVLVRDFTFGFLWSEETFAGVREASVLHDVLRRDLSRAALAADGHDLDVSAAPGSLAISVPAGEGRERIVYRFDAVARALVREAAGGSQTLGQGLLREFEAGRCYVVEGTGGALAAAGALPPGKRPFRAGLRLRLVLEGRDLAASGHPVRSLAFTTHVFPVFANLRLSSIWREP